MTKTATVTRLRAPKKTPTKSAARQQRHRARTKRQSQLLNAITVTTAAVLPVFSLGATLQTGELWLAGSLAGFATGIVAVLLFATSVPHVAKGFKHATGGSWFFACVMAAAIDGVVVAGEAARLGGGHEAGAWALMLGGSLFSAVFNAVGFTLARGSK